MRPIGGHGDDPDRIAEDAQQKRAARDVEVAGAGHDPIDLTLAPENLIAEQNGLQRIDSPLLDEDFMGPGSAVQQQPADDRGLGRPMAADPAGREKHPVRRVARGIQRPCHPTQKNAARTSIGQDGRAEYDEIVGQSGGYSIPPDRQRPFSDQ